MPSQKEISKSNFWKPSVATDVVLFTLIDYEMHVLMIERGRNPYKGKLAFPGGFLDEQDENLKSCAKRELLEETGLESKHLGMFKLLTERSGKDRDPRQNRVISISFVGTSQTVLDLKAGDDAQQVHWIPLKEITENYMAFDHFDILKDALQEMKRRADAWSQRMWDPRNNISIDQVLDFDLDD